MLKDLKEVRVGSVSYTEKLLVADLLASSFTYIDYYKNQTARDEMVAFINVRLCEAGYAIHTVDLFSDMVVTKLIEESTIYQSTFFLVRSATITEGFVDNLERLMKAGFRVIVEQTIFDPDNIPLYLRLCRLRELEFKPGHIEDRNPTQWSVSYPLQTSIRFTTN